MVFFRRRGFPSKQKTTWKKYTIAYTGTETRTTVAYSTGTSLVSAKAATSTVTYYDNLSFAADGTAAGLGENTVKVSYNTCANADQMNEKILKRNGSFYFVLNDAASCSSAYVSQYKYGAYVYKQSYGAMTTETAKSFTTAGDYVEDVESEDENAYPDKGPLGTYYYVKQ